MTKISDDDLLSELGIDLATTKSIKYTAIEERIISGFEEITAFYELNKRLPSFSVEADIFERLYAVRLKQIKRLPESIKLLSEFDTCDLLINDMGDSVEQISELDDDYLLSELGIEIENDDNILHLQNVRSYEVRKESEFVGKRVVCEDFNVFEPLFSQIQEDLNNGIRYTERYGKNNILNKGDWFMLNGQLVYISEITEYFEMTDGHKDARTRLIFSNGTESNILMRSLTKSLYKDHAGRRILPLNNKKSLSSDLVQKNLDIEGKSGSIYVLRSQSNDPYIKDNKDIIHKIGVTTGDVNKRISDASKDATYLLADVDVIAVYTLPENIVPHKLEKLIHKVLQPAQLDITITDRFGNPVKPKEWFLVPLQVIDEIIEHIKRNTLAEVLYDPLKGALYAKKERST